MRINILLPFFSQTPIGGFKVQYEYANRLAERGHRVTVIHPSTVESPEGWRARVSQLAKRGRELLEDRSRVSWHALGDDVRLLSVPDLRERFIPEADVTMATGWATAEMLKSYSKRAGRKFQIAYDYELWMEAAPAARQRMSRAFNSGQNVISTSPAVSEMLAESGVRPVAYIPCGLDFETYGIDVPIERRAWGTIGFPVREQPSKGTADALEALKTLRARHGDALRVAAFGPQESSGLPRWVRAAWLPTDAELRGFYNSISIFVFPSHYEGWGLPAVEALACGAALVTADSVGSREYALDGRTALVVPRARPDLLAAAIEILLRDDEMRRRLAHQGNAHVQQYTWARAVDALESLFAEEGRAA
ncbi:MAG TPA: glycosyltransferase family 4 protein [Pyrinomonadaceae bacterium]|jgi:glycosyltransferase involved in cell wall biosynthesis